MDAANDALAAAYATSPILPTEHLHGLLCALLDPVVRAWVNANRQGSIELHWSAAEDKVVVVTRHTSKHHKHLRVTPPTTR